MHRWYGRQWDPAATDSLPASSFCADLNKWLDDSIVATWIPTTHGVPAFQGFHRTLDEWQGCVIRTPVPVPLTPENLNPPGMVPGGCERERRVATNVSNRNRVDRVVGEAPLAKKIRIREIYFLSHVKSVSVWQQEFSKIVECCTFLQESTV